MTAALRGRRNANKSRAERELLLAYRTGAFAGAAFNGKLKPFDHYRLQTRPNASHISAVSFFHSQRAKGLAVKIERVERAANA